MLKNIIKRIIDLKIKIISNNFNSIYTMEAITNASEDKLTDGLSLKLPPGSSCITT